MSTEEVKELDEFNPDQDPDMKEIKGMSDQELMDHIQNDEFVPNKAGDNIMKATLDDMPAADIMKLYDLALKTKNNPSFNPIPELPKKIYDVIVADAKAMNFKQRDLNFLARNAVMAFGEEIALSKELKQLNEEISKAREMPELMDMFSESLYDSYVTKLKDDIQNETDPEKKQRMLDVSRGFTDSYSIKPLMDLFDNGPFVDKIVKLMYTKVEQMVDNYDFILNKVVVHKATLKSILPSLRAIYPEMEPWRRELLLLFVSKYVRDYMTPDTYLHMFMYSFLFNINAMAASLSYSKDEGEFAKTRRECLDAFFEKTREIFPDPEFPKRELKGKKGRKASTSR